MGSHMNCQCCSFVVAVVAVVAVVVVVVVVVVNRVGCKGLKAVVGFWPVHYMPEVGLIAGIVVAKEKGE